MELELLEATLYLKECYWLLLPYTFELSGLG